MIVFFIGNLSVFFFGFTSVRSQVGVLPFFLLENCTFYLAWNAMQVYVKMLFLMMCLCLTSHFFS